MKLDLTRQHEKSENRVLNSTLTKNTSVTHFKFCIFEPVFALFGIMMEVESDIFGSAEPMLDDGAMDESENVDHVENSQVMLHSQLSTVEQAIMDDIFASDDEEEDNYKQKVSSVPVDEADFDDDMRELMNNPNSNPAADQYSDIDDHSTSSESDQEVDAVVEGRKQASKMEKVAAKPRKTAVEMEIEVYFKILLYKIHVLSAYATGGEVTRERTF